MTKQNIDMNPGSVPGFYLNTIDALPVPLLAIDDSQTIVFVNKAFGKILDTPKDCLIGRSCSSIGSSACGTPNCCFERMRNNDVDALCSVVELQGTPYQVSSQWIPWLGRQSKLFVCGFSDWSDMRTLASLLHEKESQYRHVNQLRNTMLTDIDYSYEINLSKNKVTCVSQQRPSWWGTFKDRAYSDLFGQARQYAVIPAHRTLFSGLLSPKSLLALFESGQMIQKAELRVKNARGRYKWVECSSAVFQPSPQGDIYAYITLQNIEPQKRRERSLHKKALTDPLTGLSNRHSATSTIRDVLADPQYANLSGAMMIIDIDDFKQVNDKYGHPVGDKVLKETAKRMKSVFRRDDILGRLGGDEFIAYLPAVKDEAAVLDRAQQLCEITTAPISADGSICNISVSVGVAFYPHHGTTFRQLYDNADVALYHSKKHQKNCFSVFKGASTCQ